MTDFNIDKNSNYEESILPHKNQTNISPLKYNESLGKDTISDCNPKSQISIENNNVCENESSKIIFHNETNYNSNNEEKGAKDKSLYCIENTNINVNQNLSSNNLNINNNIEGNNHNKKNKLKFHKIKKHNKNSEDNIIKKIKTHFFNNYILHLIKEYSINKNNDSKELKADVIKGLSDILSDKQISTE